jgi:uncharacterized membrane protein YfcA
MFAYGAALQAVILHTKLERKEIVGTMAGALFGMSVFKITGYILVGFDYTPYLQVIVAGLAVSFVGTWIGRLAVERISEKLFRIVYRMLVTATAIRLLYVNLMT